MSYSGTAAIIGLGGGIWYNVTAGSTPPATGWVLVGEVLSASGPGLKGETVDATNFESTNGWAEKIPSINDAGDIEFSINYANTVAVALFGSTVFNKQIWWQVQTKDSKSWFCQGMLTELSQDAPAAKDKVTVKCKVTCTGQPSNAASITT